MPISITYLAVYTNLQNDEPASPYPAEDNSAPASRSTRSGNGPVLTATVKMPGSNAGLHPQRRILHHDCLPGLYASLFQPDKVRFGIGFSILHIESRYHRLRRENTWIIMRELIEQSSVVPNRLPIPVSTCAILPASKSRAHRA